MQGYSCFERPVIVGKLSKDEEEGPAPYPHARDRVEGRGGRVRRHAGEEPKPGLFGVIQKANCMAVMPEGLESKRAGDLVTCYVLDARGSRYLARSRLE